MSLAGVRSNRGDGYQKTVALGRAIEMLIDERIERIELDSTSLGPDGTPVSIDDVIVKYRDGRNDYISCKKNHKDFRSWTCESLREELVKAGRVLSVDVTSRVAFYSRSPYGELGKLSEYARTQPDSAAYRHNLSKSLAGTDATLRQCWAGVLPSPEDIHAYLNRLSFETTSGIEEMRGQHRALLAKHVVHPDLALDALWARIDLLGGRIEPAAVPDDRHSFTRSELLRLLKSAGCTIAPVKSVAELETAFVSVSAIGRSWKRDIRNHRIRRKALDELVSSVRARHRAILVTDAPGFGKTCLLLDLLDALEGEENTATLFIQAREFASCRTEAERESHGLMRNLVDQISQMAGLRHTVVIIDSLDVLSLARDHRVLGYFLGVIDQLSTRDGVTVVAACRSFDLSYDPRLANREWSCIVRIDPLDESEDVEPLLGEWGVEIDALDAETRALLTTPRHLAQFADIVRRAGACNPSSAQALTQRFLDVMVRQDPVLGETSMAQLEAMAQKLLAMRRLETPRTRLRFKDDELRTLLSAGVLHQSESGLISFGHQTLLDALAVANAEAQGLSLLDFIRSLPAVPFMRPTVREFFVRVRDTDARNFRAQLRAVFDAEVPHHWKHLIADSFGEIRPAPEDWPLLLHVQRNHPDLFRRVLRATSSGAWGELWHEHLVPLVFAEKNSALLPLCVSLSVRWYAERPAAAVAFWLQALRCEWCDRDAIRETIVRHLEEFEAWNEAGLRELFEVLVGRFVEYDRLGQPLSLYVEHTHSSEDLLWRYIVEGQRCSPSEFCDEGFLIRRFKASEFLLDRALAALENWNDREKDGLLQAVEAALIHHAVADTRWWSRSARGLGRSADPALQDIAIRACIAAPSTNPELMRKVLTDRTNIESGLVARLCELIRVGFRHLDPAAQDQVVHVVLDMTRTKRSASREHVLHPQAALLSAIPASLRSPDVQRRLVELERVFWPVECLPPVKTKPSLEPEPPFVSCEQLVAMSDDGILKMLALSQEVAFVLSEAAEQDPFRFMRLLERSWNEFPDELRSSIMRGTERHLEECRFKSGGWNAEAGAHASSVPVISLVLDELERHPDYWCEVREGARALLTCASVAEEQSHARRIVRAARVLSEAHEPRIEHCNDDELVRFGRDSTRGTAAQALLTLGGRWARFERPLPDEFDRVLMTYASDAHPAVRAVVLAELPGLLFFNPSLGWSAFARAIANPTERLWAIAQSCLHIGCLRDFGSVAGYLRQLDAHGSGEARVTWGSLSAVLYLAGITPWEELFERLSTPGNMDAWKGATEVFARNTHSPQHQDACFRGLIAALTHAPDPPSLHHELRDLFRTKEDESSVPFPEELVKLCFSMVEQFDHSHGLYMPCFEDWLSGVAEMGPDLALACATHYAAFVRRKSIVVFDHRPAAILMTQLFREAEEREQADGGVLLAEVIRLQDALLLVIPGLHEWLSEAERP